ncbi:MAG: hypothetical protein WBV39_04640 [Rudaea sp.]
MPLPHAMTISRVALIVAAGMWMLLAHAVNTVRSVLHAGAMTQLQAIRLHAEATEKSGRTMRDTQKVPVLLLQYGSMRKKYDSGHQRVFQAIFGQYLSWYQTFTAINRNNRLLSWSGTITAKGIFSNR